jgi:hypothetical protein
LPAIFPVFLWAIVPGGRSETLKVFCPPFTAMSREFPSKINVCNQWVVRNFTTSARRVTKALQDCDVRGAGGV